MPAVNLAREGSLYTASSRQAVQARQMELARIQEQLSSGRRILRASDDPSAFTEARQMEVLNDRYNQYLRSIDASQHWVDHTQDSLDGLAELYTEAYEQGVRINNSSFSDGDREAEASRLEAILDNVVDTLNARSGGEYVFGGARSNVQPFTLGGGVVTYNGDGGSRERFIGRTLRMDINIDGQRLHDTGQGFTITGALQDLIDAVRSGDPTQMDSAIQEMTVARDHVIDLGGEAGSMANRLELAANQLRDASFMVEARRTKLEDVDFAEALADFQKAQVGLQAAVRVASTVLNTTLMDYIR